jgi:hypothetical protein
MQDSTIIAVFCYKRAAKLKTSMEALLRNPECASLEIIFFCDGYKGEKDREAVLETRKYIDSLTGFKKIHKQYREKNYTTGPNFHAALTYLSQHYSRFIVVEDDVVVAPNFLKYMLDALNFYNTESSVFAVSGYSFPLDTNQYDYDTVVHKRFCSYGWGSWGAKVAKVKWDAQSLTNYVRTVPHFKKRLNKEGMDLYRMVLKQISGKISTWDIQMQVHVAINQMNVIYPVVSKTTNIGFDNESTNTFGIDYLKTVVDTGEKRNFRFCSVDSNNPRIVHQLQKPYGFQALASRKILNTLIKYRNVVKHRLSF